MTTRPTKPQYVAIGTLWPRHGFMSMPDWVILALRQAFKTCPEPNSLSENAEFNYLEHLRRWGVDPAVSLDWLRLESCASLLRPYPRPRLQTVSDIYVTNARPDFPFYRSQVFGQVVWSWDYGRFAFTVYWALFFHLTTSQLNQPQRAYEYLWELAQTLAFGLEGRPRDPRTHERHALALALYERTCGIAYDMATNQPHYIKNVAKRPGLSGPQLNRRVATFASAVEYFRRQLLNELP